MAFSITVPELGESVLDATVSRWLKHEGDYVNQGDALVELETDKVNLEVSARQAGILEHIDRKEGDDVKVGDTLGVIEETAEPRPVDHKPPAPENEKKESVEAKAGPGQKNDQLKEVPVGTGEQAQKLDELREGSAEQGEQAEMPMPEVTPVARRIASEQGVDLSLINGTGPGGRITKGDVENYIQKEASAEPIKINQVVQPPATAEAATRPETQPITAARPAEAPTSPVFYIAEGDGRTEERIKMTRRRRTIAKRLVEAQQTAAILTTFNEIDMYAVMEVRRRRNEAFQKRYEVKLGYTSFFVKASIGALKAFPAINAEIQGDDMILKHYYDIGVAVGSAEGLVVPVLRNADRMSFAEIEKKVEEFVKKTDEGTLTLEDLRGGTFTITNGGVFGSLMSTPILTPPQVGILGLHKIEKRPVVVNDEMVIRSMMYVALSYDHRIVDGREAVQFLVRVKELIEDPESLLLEG
ncbi:MAG: 2-oxoglutarate dehydrogenase complex dihydrolipoyllysine-residue succinyltransferase [Omnitrophica WOR_2 bacterium]